MGGKASSAASHNPCSVRGLPFLLSRRVCNLMLFANLSAHFLKWVLHKHLLFNSMRLDCLLWKTTYLQCEIPKSEQRELGKVAERIESGWEWVALKRRNKTKSQADLMMGPCLRSCCTVLFNRIKRQLASTGHSLRLHFNTQAQRLGEGVHYSHFPRAFLDFMKWFLAIQLHKCLWLTGHFDFSIFFWVFWSSPALLVFLQSSNC